MAKKKVSVKPKTFVVTKGKGTQAVRNPKTGKFRGRKVVSGSGDGTKVRRAKSGPFAGSIYGRTSSPKKTVRRRLD